MGGQKHIFCRKHQLPLISSSKCDGKCSVIDNNNKMSCGKKEMPCCSEFNCQVRNCKKWYDTYDEHTITYIDQPYDNCANHNMSGDTME